MKYRLLKKIRILIYEKWTFPPCFFCGQLSANRGWNLLSSTQAHHMFLALKKLPTFCSYLFITLSFFYYLCYSSKAFIDGLLTTSGILSLVLIVNVLFLWFWIAIDLLTKLWGRLDKSFFTVWNKDWCHSSLTL